MKTLFIMLQWSIIANVPLLILTLATSGALKTFFKHLFFWNFAIGIVIIATGVSRGWK